MTIERPSRRRTFAYLAAVCGATAAIVAGVIGTASADVIVVVPHPNPSLTFLPDPAICRDANQWTPGCEWARP